MKQRIVAGAALITLWASLVFAQSDVDLTRAAIEDKRRALIANNMELDEAQSQAFWPVYNVYQSEMRKVDDQRIQLMQDYAQNLETLSDDKAVELLDQFFAYEERRHQVRKSHVPKFREVLSGKQVARFYQIENKLDAVIENDLARAVPLVP